jgi:hypothetical protein
MTMNRYETQYFAWIRTPNDRDGESARQVIASGYSWRKILREIREHAARRDMLGMSVGQIMVSTQTGSVRSTRALIDLT